MLRTNKSDRAAPITIQTIRKNIHLNVRSGFDTRNKNAKTEDDKLKNFKVKNNENASTLTLEDMTAKEYADDLRAYYGTHVNKLRDILYIDTFRAAILENVHLFKDKVILAELL